MKTQRYRINGNEYDVAVNSISGNKAEVTVNGVTYQVDMEDTEHIIISEPAEESHPAPSHVERAPVVEPVIQGGKPIKSPLPGVILEVKVKVGDHVKTGQVIAVLEAMKMENEIQSESDGVVTSINVSAGEAVPEGCPIVTIG